MSHWRQYVYLLVNNFTRGTYPLRRIDASDLFFSSNPAAVSSSMRLPLEEAELPEHLIAFTPSRNVYGTTGMLDLFTLFGHGKTKSLIAGADQKGSTFLYDLDQRAVHSHATLHEPKTYDPVSLAVGDALYVMDKRPRRDGSCFEALVFADDPRDMSPSRGWRWERLPPPPYVHAPGYGPTTGISSYALVTGSSIWISTPGIGTYSFDTAKREWSKAGDWVLPFHGRVDYLPEHRVWLGFSSQDNMPLLCTSNPRTASAMTGPGLLHGGWEDLRAEEDWILNKSDLVHLGSGRFCVSRFFQREHKVASEDGGFICTKRDKFAVLTGLAVQRNRVNGEPEMIKHRSLLYRFDGIADIWAF